MKKKLYKVVVEYSTLILANNETEAVDSADWIVKTQESDVGHDFINITEVKSVKDLPDGWDGNCIPWVSNPFDSNNETVSELLADVE